MGVALAVLVVVCLGSVLATGGLVFLWHRARAELTGAKHDLARFQGIRDAEQHRNAVMAEAHAIESQHSASVATTTGRLEKLRAEVARGEAYLAQLRKDVAAVEEAGLAQSFGFYEPRYGLESSDAYSERLKQTREQQKNLVKSNTATFAPDNWTVDGSIVKGRKMVKEHVKLMLRAFNGECDAAIGRVKYNNVVNLAERVQRSFTAINKLGSAKRIEIAPGYLEAKLAELYLVHEHREKKQKEREEQQRIKDQMREEQKAQKQIEKAQADAEKDEAKQAAALQKARAELQETTGRHTAKLEQLVAKLERELSVTIDRKAKAIARAQLTRSGHVYVLSNIGSFGEGVYKIGMTRRLEPLQRVHELGDASVPFRFDVHAMIYAEDAPALERALHQHFDTRRVNRVNLRREYFRVTLDEIRKAVTKHHGIITFVVEPEAEEYRKTVAMETAIPQAVSA